MSAAAPNLSQIATQWRFARGVYPIYRALATHFHIMSVCPELEQLVDRSEPEIIDKVNEWLNSMDQDVQVWQIRQVLQSSQIASEENLRLLLNRHLAPDAKIHEVRAKVDFLLAQYLAHCAPLDFQKSEITFGKVAEVLVPVLGQCQDGMPDWAVEFEVILKEFASCQSLRDMLERSLLQRARVCKQKIPAADYFVPRSLVAVTRFNFLMRVGFVRLMHLDLHAIREAMYVLETRGIGEVDCTQADLSPTETLASIQAICHEWKKPFRASYSLGNSFRQIVDIRSALEAAVAKSGSRTAMAEPGAKREQSATAQRPVSAAVSLNPAGSDAAPAPVAKNMPAAAPTAPEMPPVPSPTSAPPQPSAHPSEAAPVVSSNPSTPAIPSDGGAEGKAREFSLSSCTELIAQQVLKVSTKGVAVCNVVVEGNKAVLASWEVSAFRATDEVSLWLQKAVSCRVFLGIIMEKHKRKETQDLPQIVSTLEKEASDILAHIEEAKARKDIDAAVNLAATNKKFASLMEEARKLVA